MSDAKSVDATSVLFGLEDEFCVLDARRVDAATVKVMVEQIAREGPCPDCGVFTSTVKDRPVMRLKDVPASGQRVELWWRNAGWSVPNRGVRGRASPSPLLPCVRGPG
jgi:hypothetical protein